MRQRELLRHHAAERLAVEVRRRNAEMIKEAHSVVDEREHRHGLVRRIRASVSSEVERDDVAPFGERPDVPPPSGDVAAQTLQQEQRDPPGRSVKLEIQPASVRGVDIRHQGEGAKVSMMASWFWEIRSAAGPIQVPPRTIRSATSAKAVTRSRHSSGGPATANVSTIGMATSAMAAKSWLAKARRRGSTSSPNPCNSSTGRDARV